MFRSTLVISETLLELLNERNKTNNFDIAISVLYSSSLILWHSNLKNEEKSKTKYRNIIRAAFRALRTFASTYAPF